MTTPQTNAGHAPVAGTIAAFVAGTGPGDLPANVLHEAKRSLDRKSVV